MYGREGHESRIELLQGDQNQFGWLFFIVFFWAHLFHFHLPAPPFFRFLKNFIHFIRYHFSFYFSDKKLPKNEKLDKERSKSSSNSEAEFIHQHFEDSESDYDENNGTINFNIVDEDEEEVQP